MSMEEEKAYGAPAEEAKEREGGKRRTLLAFLLALLLILGVIAALEFVPASPFEGLLRGWLEETRSAIPSSETSGNPANDETAPAVSEWLATEQPEVTTVPPPSFPSEDAAADTADDGEGEETDAPDDPDDPAASADPSASVPSQDGSSSPGSGSTSGSPSSGTGTGSSSGSSGGSDSNPGTNPGTTPGSGTTAGSGTTSDDPSSSVPSEPHVHTLAERSWVEEEDVIEHVDAWTEVIHHEGYTNHVAEPISRCQDCGENVTGHTSEHMQEYGHHGWYSDQIIHDVWVEPYDEVIEHPAEDRIGHRSYLVEETYCTVCGEVVYHHEW